MSEQNTFADFLKRVRAGDAQAAADLIRQYESVIRLEVRMRLTDPRLGRIFDSMDICQSVLASFFVRAAAGQYDLADPKQLVRLLVVMARNKLAFQARRQKAQRRDHRKNQPIMEGEFDAPGRESTPSQIVAGKELLAEFRQRLLPEERQLADLRAAGEEWGDIATAMGGTPQARRKQLERAISRVSQELGLDEE